MKKFFSVGFTVFIYLLIYSFFQGLYLIVVTLYYSSTSPNLNEAEFTDLVNAQIPLAIIFAAILSFLIYAWIVTASKKQNIFTYCKFKALPLKKVVMLIFAGLSLVSLNALTVVGISMLFPDAYDLHVENMMGLTSSGGWLMVVSVGLAAPFIEEIMFRGLITNELDRVMSYKWIIFVQALLFGIYHMNIVQGIYTFILAIFMGYALHWTGSIWAPLIIHIVNNMSSVIMSEFVDSTSDIVNIGFGIWILASLFFVLPYTLKYLYRTRIEEIELDVSLTQISSD